jgi:hypothetical protein
MSPITDGFLVRLKLREEPVSLFIRSFRMTWGGNHGILSRPQKVKTPPISRGFRPNLKNFFGDRGRTCSNRRQTITDARTAKPRLNSVMLCFWIVRSGP